MKNIYLIRHCEATGQPPEAPLTVKGHSQSQSLIPFFADFKIDQIISSPYLRAIQSIQPLAAHLNLQLETDHRLTERILSTSHLPDWLEQLKMTFDDMNLRLEGGESSHEATARIVEVTEQVFTSGTSNTIIVTHGNLMSLLLKFYNPKFGFHEWKNLSNPDVYLLSADHGNIHVKRVWDDRK